MTSRISRLLVAAVTLAALAACEGGSSDPDPTPTRSTSSSPTATATEAPDISEHEAGPESPIAFGLSTPEGAVQLGPLFRYRSSRLIAAYQPELDAAEAQRDAEIAKKIAEDEAQGTPSPTPTPTPTTLPSSDTFDIIDGPPRPDTTVSLMRIDGSPSDVVRRMLAQIDAALPDADLVLDNLSEYCTSSERRITGCHVSARGVTDGEREIRVTLDVDPGLLRTRTSGPADETKPVMQLVVEYVGDPRAGQLSRETGSLDNVASVDSEDEKSGLIWPKMDEDASNDVALVNGWRAPDSATLLLTSFRTPFVA
ncbi:MAG: hypothetical protein JWP31_893, partial [Aeromicrobium sp.]|nr:hypothetical protein [Aeromicrobium sp.]